MAVQNSQSQTATYTALGNKDDFRDIITNIDPDMTMFLSAFDDGDPATQLKINWMTEGLRPPQKNAHIEMVDYESVPLMGIEQRDNTCQHFINSGKVSDAQRKTKKWYNQSDELGRQMQNAFDGHSRDIEYAIVYGDTSRLGNETIPPLVGGIPYFMQIEGFDVSFDTTKNTVVCTMPHDRKTGEFIYFVADGGALPPEVEANVMYYIRLDATDPAKEFKLYDSINDAIEDKNAITFSAAGTGKAIRNNIIDLEKKADYTDETINDLMQMIYYRGGKPTLAVMSGAKKRRFSSIVAANATRLRDQHDKKATNGALNDIEKNVSDTMAQQYQSNVGLLGSVLGQQMAGAMGGIQAAAGGQQAALQSPLQLLQAGSSLQNSGVNSTLGQLISSRTGASTTTTSGGGSMGLLGGLLGGFLRGGL